MEPYSRTKMVLEWLWYSLCVSYWYLFRLAENENYWTNIYDLGVIRNMKDHTFRWTIYLVATRLYRVSRNKHIVLYRWPCTTFFTKFDDFGVIYLWRVIFFKKLTILWNFLDEYTYTLQIWWRLNPDWIKDMREIIFKPNLMICWSFTK